MNLLLGNIRMEKNDNFMTKFKTLLFNVYKSYCTMPSDIQHSNVFRIKHPWIEIFMLTKLLKTYLRRQRPILKIIIWYYQFPKLDDFYIVRGLVQMSFIISPTFLPRGVYSGWGIVVIVLVRPYVRPYIRTYVRPKFFLRFLFFLGSSRW